MAFSRRHNFSSRIATRIGSSSSRWGIESLHVGSLVFVLGFCMCLVILRQFQCIILDTPPKFNWGWNVHMQSYANVWMDMLDNSMAWSNYVWFLTPIRIKTQPYHKHQGWLLAWIFEIARNMFPRRLSCAKISNGMDQKHARAFPFPLSFLFFHVHWLFVSIVKYENMKSIHFNHTYVWLLISPHMLNWLNCN